MQVCRHTKQQKRMVLLEDVGEKYHGGVVKGQVPAPPRRAEINSTPTVFWGESVP